jgi:hypothetical protein
MKSIPAGKKHIVWCLFNDGDTSFEMDIILNPAPEG